MNHKLGRGVVSGVALDRNDALRIDGLLMDVDTKADLSFAAAAAWEVV